MNHDKTALLEYVGYVVNDALSAKRVHSLADVNVNLDRDRLVSIQCEYEPMVVLVQSYLPGISIDKDEALDLAKDYLIEIGWTTVEAFDSLRITVH